MDSSARNIDTPANTPTDTSMNTVDTVDTPVSTTVDQPVNTVDTPVDQLASTADQPVNTANTPATRLLESILGDAQTSPEPTEPTFGLHDGVYTTPYKVTVIYHPESIFETTVAHLCTLSQPIPVGPNADLDAIADSCEHPSPEVVSFVNLSASALKRFYARGFQLIHIFTNAECPTSDDVRVVWFNTSNLHDHIAVRGFTSMLLLDHIMLAAYPGYESRYGGVSVEAGQHLCRALRESRVPLVETVVGIASTPYGFDTITQLVAEGRALALERERVADRRLAKSLVVRVGEYSVAAVSAEDRVNELLELAPAHPKLKQVDYALLYSFEPVLLDDVVHPGWKLTAIRINQSAPSAVEFLHPGCNAQGLPGIATGWVPTPCSVLLPFIYPTVHSDATANRTSDTTGETSV